MSSELRVLAAAALLAGGVAAAVSAVAVRYTVSSVPGIASVRLGELTEAYAARAVRRDATPEEAAVVAQVWALELEASLKRVASRHGLVLLPARAVAAGAADVTDAVVAELASAASRSATAAMDRGGAGAEARR